MDLEHPVVEQTSSVARGNFCRPEDGVLLHPYDPQPPTSLTRLVHEAFRGLALNERFSCVAGRLAVRHNAYRFGLYDHMGNPASVAALGSDLKRFVADEDLREQPMTTFVASFINPVPVDEEKFEDLLWSTLQQLNNLDVKSWAPGRQREPENPRFSFSFHGTGFFIVGLHANSSRFARRFAWSTLVFNPHEQFDRLRQEGRYGRFREAIRAREIDLQGSVNPMLRDFGEQSEARQYSGRAVSDSWKCPFHARSQGPKHEVDE